jgi:DNA-nicking Smr family endonuclease
VYLRLKLSQVSTESSREESTGNSESQRPLRKKNQSISKTRVTTRTKANTKNTSKGMSEHYQGNGPAAFRRGDHEGVSNLRVILAILLSPL